jgi:hypothetical protein
MSEKRAEKLLRRAKRKAKKVEGVAPESPDRYTVSGKITPAGMQTRIRPGPSPVDSLIRCCVGPSR